MSKDVAKILLYKQVEVHKIYSNFTYYKQRVKLSYTFIEALGVGMTILKQQPNELVSANYMKNFADTTATLNSLEQMMVFIFANSLTVFYPEMIENTEVVYDYLCKKVDRKMYTVIVIHGVNYAIVGLFILSLIPTIVRIHGSKKNLLMLFGEIPLHLIKKLNNNCKEFLMSDLSHINNTGSVRAGKGDQGAEETFKAAGKFEAEDAMPLLVKGTPEQNEAEGKPAEEELDEGAKRLLEKAQEEQEKAFMDERKQSIKGVIINLLGIVISLTLMFGVIIGYHSKTFFSMKMNKKNNVNSIYALMILQQRFLSVTNTLVFYKMFLKSIDGYIEPIDIEKEFEENYAKVIRNENLIENFINYPSGNLDKLGKLLREYDSPQLCELAISNGANVTLEWCRTVQDGILNEGFTKTISYFLLLVRNNYYTIKEYPNMELIKLMASRSSIVKDTSNIFIMLFSPIFDYLAEKELELFVEQTNRDITLLVVDYILEFVFCLLGLIVLTKYFVKRMEEELFMVRGILALLPEDMIKHNAMLEALIENNQLS
eukprot:TRINITY_DN4761_c0_g3_i2.p1 TRINITY_DN4761_c0_g3~~TRINITY_DN4761_c0_g3_i2.p1  ORF type:complete len:603 (+),score=190.11 TRINITY_DN4761_c0_g3_i2:181-1809(+)